MSSAGAAEAAEAAAATAAAERAARQRAELEAARAERQTAEEEANALRTQLEAARMAAAAEAEEAWEAESRRREAASVAAEAAAAAASAEAAKAEAAAAEAAAAVAKLREREQARAQAAAMAAAVAAERARAEAEAQVLRQQLAAAAAEAEAARAAAAAATAAEAERAREAVRERSAARAAVSRAEEAERQRVAAEEAARAKALEAERWRAAAERPAGARNAGYAPVQEAAEGASRATRSLAMSTPPVTLRAEWEASDLSEPEPAGFRLSLNFRLWPWRRNHSQAGQAGECSAPTWAVAKDSGLDGAREEVEPFQKYDAEIEQTAAAEQAEKQLTAEHVSAAMAETPSAASYDATDRAAEKTEEVEIEEAAEDKPAYKSDAAEDAAAEEQRAAEDAGLSLGSLSSADVDDNDSFEAVAWEPESEVAALIALLQDPHTSAAGIPEALAPFSVWDQAEVSHPQLPAAPTPRLARICPARAQPGSSTQFLVRTQAIGFLEGPLLVRAVSAIPPSMQAAVVDALALHTGAGLLAELGPLEGARLLDQLPPARVEPLLQATPPLRAAQVRALMGQNSAVAESTATTIPDVSARTKRGQSPQPIV